MRVYIERDRSRLRIWIIYQGKRYQFSTGLTDTNPHRAYVQGIASRMELDMVSGQFDATLTSYRPQSIGSNSCAVTCAELFAKFTSAREADGLSRGALEGCVANNGLGYKTGDFRDALTLGHHGLYILQNTVGKRD